MVRSNTSTSSDEVEGFSLIQWELRTLASVRMLKKCLVLVLVLVLEVVIER